MTKDAEIGAWEEPPERSFGSIDCDNLVISALKKADRDGNEF